MSKDLDISNYDCSDLMKLFKINKLHGSHDQIEKMCKKIDSKFEQPYQEFYKKGKKILNVLEKAFENDPESAYNYSIFINQRLEEKTENVFLRDTIEERGDVLHEDFFWACLYAKNVLKGKFPEKTHKSLFLRYSFDDG